MAHVGQTIENPVSGERFTFLKTAADTNGEFLSFELVLRPGRPGPLRMAVRSHGLGQQDYAPGIPMVAQQAAFVVLSAIGQLLGYGAAVTK